MFVPICNITITQVSTDQYPNRTKKFVFNFLNEASGHSTWEHLTDTLRLVMPRKIYFKDESTGKVTTWDKEPIYGNPDVQPLLLRGDMVSVEWGYSYFKNNGKTTFDRNTSIIQVSKRFDGFISRIKNKTPFEIECKDNMFLLQQELAPSKDYVVDGKTYTVEKMIKEMLSKAKDPRVRNFKVKVDNYMTSLGTKMSWSNFTIAQVLDDLEKNLKLVSFFRGNELRVGLIRYYPEDRVKHTFHFQRNIVEDDLDYQRADDVRIGIIAKSINKVELVSINKSGVKKTKHVQLTTTVGDADGELRTIFFWGANTTAELRRKAEKKLPFIKYEGFRGSFVTFALPTVKHGDIVSLVDDVLPERNGDYLVKAVDQIANVDGGLKQRIYIDIRIDQIADEKLLTEYQRNGL